MMDENSIGKEIVRADIVVESKVIIELKSVERITNGQRAAGIEESLAILAALREKDKLQQVTYADGVPPLSSSVGGRAGLIEVEYFPDTSFVCSRYREQPFSPQANAWMDKHPDPLPVSSLLLLEFRLGSE